MKATDNSIATRINPVIRIFTICILVMAILSGCMAGADTGAAAEAEPNGEPISENAVSEASDFQLEPLVFTSEAEEAFYSFDWLRMSLAEDLVIDNMTFSCTVRFADLDLDGNAEILLSSEGGYPLCSGLFPTMVFTVNGSQLEPVATVILAQDEFTDVYGPESWGGGEKQYYENAANQRVVLEFAVYRLEPHIYTSNLYEVSLDDYSTTPVLLYREPDSHFASQGSACSWYYYDREKGSCSIKDLRDYISEEDELIAQGIIPITESEYNQRMEEYLAALTPAGTLPASEFITYPVSLGVYGNDGLDVFEIVIPDGVEEEQKNELINRGLAKKMY